MKNPAYVTLLTAAKDVLWNGTGGIEIQQEQYICHCIDRVCATPEYEVLVVSAYTLKQLLHHRLGCNKNGHNWVSLSLWLERVAKIPPEDLTTRAVQAHRLAWINELIKEFSNG